MENAVFKLFVIIFQHLDVKSGNVLLDLSRCRALLCDFGLSRRLRGREDEIALGGVKGTPAWMPPEVIGD